MKKTVLALMIGLMAVFTWSCSDDDDNNVITEDALPTAAKTFLSYYYQNDPVAKITTETEKNGSAYEVVLKSGTEIEFDAAGQWTDVDCAPGQEVPTWIVPAAITEYVNSNYSGATITELTKGTNPAWEVELSNNVELMFNSDFDVISL